MYSNTQGLVLRNVKYGESSLISTLYTRDFGLQAYMLKGARSARKSGIKANYFQIGQFLDLSVHHKPGSNLQFVKEVKLSNEHVIQSQHIAKQSITQFCCELVLRCVKEEEENKALYNFLSRFLSRIRDLKKEKLALAPIHFTHQFAAKIGFEIYNNQSATLPYFDAMNGVFCKERSTNSYTSSIDTSQLISECLKGNVLSQPKQSLREDALNDLLRFLKLHIDHMGEVKSVPILHTILHN